MAIDSAVDLLRLHGPLALILLMALNRLGLVPGGMVILVTVGTAFAPSSAALVVALIAAYVGTMIGDTALYAAGRYGFGWLSRRQKGRESYGRAHALVERWGLPAVFLTRWLILPLTIAVNLICGINSYRYRPFVVAGAVGNFIFVVIFIGLGYRFGENWQLFLGWAGEALGSALTNGSAMVAFGLVALTFLVYRRLRRRPTLLADQKPGFLG